MYLAQRERDIFFKLYFDLLYFVNKKHKIAEDFANTRFPKGVNTQGAYEIREMLFKNPAWIDDYIRAHGKEYSDEELSILVSWRDHFISDTFFVMKSLVKYSVFMSSGSDSESLLYGVIGLNHPIADLFYKSDLPRMVSAVILPFKDKIIYDGILISNNVRIGANMRGNLNDQYRRIKEQYGIAVSLPFSATPNKAEKKTAVKTAIKKPSQELYDSIAPLITGFCDDYLTEEYNETSLRMLGKLSRKRPSPLLKGNPNTWACGIVYAVGSNNFLFDKTQNPHMRAAELAEKFGLSQSTAGNKSREINKILKISMFDPEWTLPSRIGDNPLIWMFENERGILFDARHAPREIQARLFNAGLIPFIPADRQ